MIIVEPSVSAQALGLTAWMHIWCLVYPHMQLDQVVRLHKAVLIVNPYHHLLRGVLQLSPANTMTMLHVASCRTPFAAS